MVSGDGENRCGVVAVGLEELVVVVGRLTKVVDEVAEMEEERWNVGGVGFGKVRDHLVGNQRLGLGAIDVACIADGVKDHLTGFLDGGDGSRAGCAVYLGERQNGLDRRDERHGDGRWNVDAVVFLVSDGILEAGGIRSRFWLSKDRLTGGRWRRGSFWVLRLLMVLLFFGGGAGRHARSPVAFFEE